MNRGRVLPQSFFKRPAPEVARDLLGAVLVSRIGEQEMSGRISEAEAYLGSEDPASHAWNGRRHAQNEGLYRPAGWWYVYLSYGVHWCANLVCTPAGLGSAVLLRAMIPTSGVEVIQRRRGDVHPRELANGPGKLDGRARHDALTRSAADADLAGGGSSRRSSAGFRSAGHAPHRHHKGGRLAAPLPLAPSITRSSRSMCSLARRPLL